MSKLRQRIAMIIKAEETQDSTNQAADQLIQQYSDCKNLHNKISPLVIVYKRDIGELQTMAPKAMADFIIQRINELNNQFRSAGVKSDTYDFTTNWLQKMKVNMYQKRNTMDALMYFSNAVLKGDNLGANVDENTKNEVDKIKKKPKQKSASLEGVEYLFETRGEAQYMVDILNHFLKNSK